MSSYRQVRNGFVNLGLGDGDLALINRNLKSYLRTSHDFKVKKDPQVIADVIKQIRLITGDDFKGFLLANYNNGLGPMAGMVRDIVLYLNGKVSPRSVITSIRIEANKVINYNDPRTTWESKPLVINRLDTETNSKLMKITDYDLYYFIAGLSVEKVATLFLALSGESADV
jgi:hypothetical protein